MNWIGPYSICRIDRWAHNTMPFLIWEEGKTFPLFSLDTKETSPVYSTRQKVEELFQDSVMNDFGEEL